MTIKTALVQMFNNPGVFAAIAFDTVTHVMSDSPSSGRFQVHLSGQLNGVVNGNSQGPGGSGPVSGSGSIVCTTDFSGTQATSKIVVKGMFTSPLSSNGFISSYAPSLNDNGVIRISLTGTAQATEAEWLAFRTAAGLPAHEYFAKPASVYTGDVPLFVLFSGYLASACNLTVGTATVASCANMTNTFCTDNCCIFFTGSTGCV